MAYVVAIWLSFLFDSFVKIWDTCENFLGKWFTAPPGEKFPVRLCLALASERRKKDIIVQKTLDGSRASKLVGEGQQCGRPERMRGAGEMQAE